MRLKKNVKIVEKVDKEIFEYVLHNVLPRYTEAQDGCHDIDHVCDVIERSFDLLQNLSLGLDPNLVFVIAAYHDIGRVVDDETHEIESAKIFMADSFMSKKFSSKTREIIANAIKDHRSSLKGEPRSDYGKLVSSADRNHNLEQPLKRTYQYRLKFSPDSSLEQKIAESYRVLRDKFGENGTAATVWFDDGLYKKYLQDLRSLMCNYEAFRAEYLKINNINS